MNIISESNSSNELELLRGDCYYALGYLYLNTGQFGDTEYFQNAISMFEECIEIHLNIGVQ